LDQLAGGISIDELLTDYPNLVREDMLAAIAYGAEATRERIIPVPTVQVCVRFKLDENIGERGANLLRGRTASAAVGVLGAEGGAARMARDSAVDAQPGHIPKPIELDAGCTCIDCGRASVGVSAGCWVSGSLQRYY